MSPFNISERRRRDMLINSRLGDLGKELQLAVDCCIEGCGGERRVLIRELAGVYGPDQTLAGVLRRMRCSMCDGRVGAASLLTPDTTPGRRPIRIPLNGG